MKINCDIFRDLFPSYIKEEISDNTKRFVDNHLEECSECKSILDDMINDEKEENNNTIQQKEINGLKKINRQIISLKCIIVLLVIVIISSLGIVEYKKYVGYKNGIAIYELLNKSYENTKKFEISNNFSFYKNVNNDYITTFYYKDGKFKETNEYLKDYMSGIPLRYGEINSQDIYYIDFKNNIISVSKYQNKNNQLEIFETNLGDVLLKSLVELKPGDFKNCIVEEKTYNDIPCCILKRKEDNFIYECLYFNKENSLLLRYEKLNYNGEIIYFNEYTYSSNTVFDEDIKIKEDLSKYEIYNYDESIRYIEEF